MKQSKYVFGLALLALAFVFNAFTPTDQGRWTILGERKVNLGVDHDKIVVGANDGVFTKLKLKVKRSGINLHKVVVHFGNGERQELAVREDIQRGGETRVIDLKGNTRVIKEVDFWYDTKGLINNKAVVVLLGKH